VFPKDGSFVEWVAAKSVNDLALLPEDNAVTSRGGVVLGEANVAAGAIEIVAVTNLYDSKPPNPPPAPVTTASDVLGYAVAKYTESNQTASGVAPPNQYVFNAFVVARASGTILSATLTLPNGPTKTFPQRGGGFGFDDVFTTKSSLDAAYPSGTYTITVNTLHDGTKKLTVNMTDAYPNVPQFTNYAAAQAIDPTRDFTLTWSPFAGATPSDLIALRIGDVVNLSLLPATATSYTIPANTLKRGTTYDAEVIFQRSIRQDSRDYPGAGSSNFLSNTFSNITTIGTASASADTGFGRESAPSEATVRYRPGGITTTVEDPRRSARRLGWVRRSVLR
jgi:hypothetical protein